MVVKIRQNASASHTTNRRRPPICPTAKKRAARLGSPLGSSSHAARTALVSPMMYFMSTTIKHLLRAMLPTACHPFAMTAARMPATFHPDIVRPGTGRHHNHRCWWGNDHWRRTGLRYDHRTGSRSHHHRQADGKTEVHTGPSGNRRHPDHGRHQKHFRFHKCQILFSDPAHPSESFTGSTG